MLILKIINEIKIPVQGGLDPKVLLTDKKFKIEVTKYLQIFKDHPTYLILDMVFTRNKN